MGAVYLAQRADGAFNMRVAVKLLPSGISTEAIRRHFSDERQILARLAHPGSVACWTAVSRRQVSRGQVSARHGHEHVAVCGRPG
jgi:serine/threonine protein kinase